MNKIDWDIVWVICMMIVLLSLLYGLYQHQQNANDVCTNMNKVAVETADGYACVEGVKVK